MHWKKKLIMHSWINFFKRQGWPQSDPHTAQLQLICAHLMEWGAEMLVIPEGSGEKNHSLPQSSFPGEPTWHRSPCYPQHFHSSLSIFEPTEHLSKVWGSLLPTSRCLFANIFRALPIKCCWRLTNNRHKPLPKGSSQRTWDCWHHNNDWKREGKREEHCSMVTFPCLIFLPAC